MLLWRRRICPRLARRRAPATTAANVGITSRGWPLERRHAWVVVAQVHAMPGACCPWNPEEAGHMSAGPVLVPELRRWRDISVLYDGFWKNSPIQNRRQVLVRSWEAVHSSQGLVPGNIRHCVVVGMDFLWADCADR